MRDLISVDLFSDVEDLIRNAISRLMVQGDRISLLSDANLPGALSIAPIEASLIDSKINAFKSFLADKGYITTLRTTRGDGVDAACGQLVGNLSKSAVKGKKLISHKSL